MLWFLSHVHDIAVRHGTYASEPLVCGGPHFSAMSTKTWDGTEGDVRAMISSKNLYLRLSSHVVQLDGAILTDGECNEDTFRRLDCRAAGLSDARWCCLARGRRLQESAHQYKYCCSAFELARNAKRK
ncbi:uncharacterized protein PV09_02190 [Verruconis gallopava]|uniref:Uncharacterized protein n=1 Tax=Verruconis gallopava TaxID=253628 RepID=A0A0D1Z317_9PEZI|nr:uncharacterized protein PV09_02190 [Verruconis gallopava]KIW07342.1 hypothetical protein PV09_02190 [Verruconis gallopava]